MISIVIPTYNEEKYIADAISQFNKLSLSHEIIVTDDKSTDSTVSIAKGFSGVTVLVPEKKSRAIGENRNRGAKVATGEFLIFMDSDSRIENPDEFLSKALKMFEFNPKLVGIVPALSVWQDVETFTDKVIYVIFNLVHVFKNNIFHTGEASGKLQIIRRNAFIRVNGFRPDLVTREDADMFQRLAKVGRTSCEMGLKVRHSGRRAHKIGWPKLLSIWMLESYRFAFNKKSAFTEWEDIR